MYNPEITSLYAAIMALMLFCLFMYVVKARFQYKIGIGDGGNEELQRRIRIHGNFIENVPILLILMLMLEINGLPGWLLHTYGIIMVTSRAMHAYGLAKSAGASLPRFLGGVGTNALLLFGAFMCIYGYLFN